jgi:hypothetical protein
MAPRPCSVKMIPASAISTPTPTSTFLLMMTASPPGPQPASMPSSSKRLRNRKGSVFRGRPLSDYQIECWYANDDRYRGLAQLL